MSDVLSIVCNHLEQFGYDGLYNSDVPCGCNTEDLIPCGMDCSSCLPGYQIPCDCGEGCAFHIGPKKKGE